MKAKAKRNSQKNIVPKIDREKIETDRDCLELKPRLLHSMPREITINTRLHNFRKILSFCIIAGTTSTYAVEVDFVHEFHFHLRGGSKVEMNGGIKLLLL